MRRQLASEGAASHAFGAAFLAVAPAERDGWLDVVLGIDDVPDDGPSLPQGCVPYMPCAVDAMQRALEHAEVRARDVFVDVGSGIGRASAFVHLMTGASAIGIEVQPELVHRARELTSALHTSGITVLEGDAVQVVGTLTGGTVFFLYCPFSGERLTALLAQLETIAREHVIRICCVDLPLPPCSWLVAASPPDGDVVVYRSTLG